MAVNIDTIKNRDTLIAFDPSFVTMGCAIYKPSTKGLLLHTGDFDGVLNWVNIQPVKLNECIAVVEDPTKNSNIFGMWAMVKSEIEKMKYKKGATMGTVQSKVLTALKVASDVGKNRAAAERIIKLLEKAGVPVITISPSDRQKAFKKINGKTLRLPVKQLVMPTKTTKQQFKELTGFSSQSSEHSRDAATMIINKTAQWARVQAQIEYKKRLRQPSRPTPTNGNISLFKTKPIENDLPF